MKAKKWSAIFPCRLMKLSTSSNRMRTGASATAKRFPRTLVPGGADLALGPRRLRPLLPLSGGHVDPGGFGPVAGVPGVAHESCDFHFVRNCRSGLLEQVLDSGQIAGPFACPGDVVQARQRVGLSTPELGDEGEYRGGAFGLSRQSSQDRTGVFSQDWVKYVLEKNCSGSW